MTFLALIMAAYGAMSLVTFSAFWLDKRAARLGRWRTPEVTLHFLELLGGWPGALLARRVLRHKSRKSAYRLVLFAIIALHILLWIALVYIVLDLRRA